LQFSNVSYFYLAAGLTNNMGLPLDDDFGNPATPFSCH
jgi:hypothetical protein